MYKEIKEEIKKYYDKAKTMTLEECLKEHERLENKIRDAFERDEIIEEEFYSLMAEGNFEFDLPIR